MGSIWIQCCNLKDFSTALFFSDPETKVVARLSRAEAYTALKQYRLALEDAEFCQGSSWSAEVSRPQTLQQLIIPCQRDLVVE